jgi:hypothetical protein
VIGPRCGNAFSTTKACERESIGSIRNPCADPAARAIAEPSRGSPNWVQHRACRSPESPPAPVPGAPALRHVTAASGAHPTRPATRHALRSRTRGRPWAAAHPLNTPPDRPSGRR